MVRGPKKVEDHCAYTINCSYDYGISFFERLQQWYVVFFQKLKCEKKLAELFYFSLEALTQVVFTSFTLERARQDTAIRGSTKQKKAVILHTHRA